MCPHTDAHQTMLAPLIEKALTDAGYDLVSEVGDGWWLARTSGVMDVGVRIRPSADGTLILIDDAPIIDRLGLKRVAGVPGATFAHSAQDLHRALRALHTLQSCPEPRLSAKVEARLAAIPVTERTREVRERIGQDVFREALMEFWDGRCALSGMRLPPALLRASHAKPWAQASDREKLDPFNGLLLAVRYDALFDQGLIAFADDGRLLIAPSLDEATRRFVGLQAGMRLRYVLPGHIDYLHHHRKYIATWE